MRAVKDGQAVQVEARNVTLAIRSADGKETKIYILAMREPQTGANWWTYQQASATAAAEEPPDWDHVVDFTGPDAVGFVFSTPYLEIREIRGRQPTLAAVQQAALADLQRSIQSLRDGSLRWGHEVSVAGKIGRDFMYVKNSAAFFPQPRVTSVKRSGRGWEITLQGPNRDLALLSLDEQYQITGVRREPAAQ